VNFLYCSFQNMKKSSDNIKMKVWKIGALERELEVNDVDPADIQGRIEYLICKLSSTGLRLSNGMVLGRNNLDQIPEEFWPEAFDGLAEQYMEYRREGD